MASFLKLLTMGAIGLGAFVIFRPAPAAEPAPASDEAVETTVVEDEPEQPDEIEELRGQLAALTSRLESFEAECEADYQSTEKFSRDIFNALHDESQRRRELEESLERFLVQVSGEGYARK